MTLFNYCPSNNERPAWVLYPHTPMEVPDMTRESRRDQLVRELTETLARLGCVDTDKAIQAFETFIAVTLEDEYGPE